jgi:hypothetical protein
MGKSDAEASRMLAGWKKSKTLTEALYRSPTTHETAKRIVLDETKARDILEPLYQAPEVPG